MNHPSRSLPALLFSILQSHWLAAAVIIAESWWWQIAVLRSASELPWLAVTGASMLGGFVALECLQSARPGITAPQTMLLLGVLGMLFGLALDARGPGLAVLASLCRSGGPSDFLALLHLHWTWLPAMHAGMVVGGMTAIPILRTSRQCCRRQLCARVFQNAVCSAGMIAGMTFGTLVYQRAAGSFIHGDGPTGMLGGMFAGMVWGMVVSVAVYRLYFSLRKKPV